MTAINKKFTLLDTEATLQKVRYSKRTPPKPRRNTKGVETPFASQGDEDVLKAKIGLYIDTQDYDILKCFTISDNIDLVNVLRENSNIPSLAFNNSLLNYQIIINESLEVDFATLDGFKAIIYNNTEGYTVLRLYFNASFCIDGRMVALLSEFWKEKIVLSLEPSTPQDKSD